MVNNVVVVESPSKAKTINKYLGTDYEVIASFGHVRDLPPKDGSVNPDDGFSMQWQVDGRGQKQLGLIAKACKGATNLFLATDPDREGEAIAWHIIDELEKLKLTQSMEVKRVVFHEITKKAVNSAFHTPRILNKELIDAYLARRALDYLVGFTLSPVLWRKLPGARSAGRVQSVALRLICDRENEIEAFNTREYWSILADLQNAQGVPYQALLTHLEDKKLGKFDLATKQDADHALDLLAQSDLTITDIEAKETKRNPAPPFTTSTLQQEASRKCFFSSSQTMQLAQKLYEGIDFGGETVGLITYMRTDSTSLSDDALSQTRSFVQTAFGKEYLPNQPRIYKTKAKNAQEAHEAIRPVDVSKTPEMLSRYLDQNMLKLYSLIWKRTLASQMEQAIFDQVSATLTGDKAKLRATGQSLKFDGFLKLYQEDVDDKEDQDEAGDSSRLPTLHKGETASLAKVTPRQHFTQPPPRYSEASLVKKMEELGIGRPSTYASIIKVLQDREYVALDKRRFMPQELGRLLTAFLCGFFNRYFDYEFTATMEAGLDQISDGKLNWHDLLQEFWDDFSKRAEESTNLTFQDVRAVLDAALGAHYFPKDDDGSQEKARTCPACADGKLSLNYGKFGIYITCSNYPECTYKRGKPIAGDGEEDGMVDYPIALGDDPVTQMAVSLREGPYGIYVQREALPAAEESETEKKPTKKTTKKKKTAPKPDRVGLPKSIAPDQVTLTVALQLLALPRIVGTHPETAAVIEAGLGRYGAYLRHDGKYISLGVDDDVLMIGLNRAVSLIADNANKPAGRGGNATTSLGEHSNGGAISLGKGRFGPYVKWGKIFASIPKSIDPSAITLEEAIELVNAKAEKAPATKKPVAKKAPAKKPAAQKAPAKKPAAKKAAPKKPAAPK
ncbi:MAG: type I DNA topoisomerase [Alphaproteobacteria bacterium]